MDQEPKVISWDELEWWEKEPEDGDLRAVQGLDTWTGEEEE